MSRRSRGEGLAATRSRARSPPPVSWRSETTRSSSPSRRFTISSSFASSRFVAAGSPGANRSTIGSMTGLGRLTTFRRSAPGMRFTTSPRIAVPVLSARKGERRRARATTFPSVSRAAAPRCRPSTTALSLGDMSGSRAGIAGSKGISIAPSSSRRHHWTSLSGPFSSSFLRRKPSRDSEISRSVITVFEVRQRSPEAFHLSCAPRSRTPSSITVPFFERGPLKFASSSESTLTSIVPARFGKTASSPLTASSRRQGRSSVARFAPPLPWTLLAMSPASSRSAEAPGTSSGGACLGSVIFPPFTTTSKRIERFSSSMRVVNCETFTSRPVRGTIMGNSVERSSKVKAMSVTATRSTRSSGPFDPVARGAVGSAAGFFTSVSGASASSSAGAGSSGPGLRRMSRMRTPSFSTRTRPAGFATSTARTWTFPAESIRATSTWSSSSPRRTGPVLPSRASTARTSRSRPKPRARRSKSSGSRRPVRSWSAASACTRPSMRSEPSSFAARSGATRVRPAPRSPSIASVTARSGSSAKGATRVVTTRELAIGAISVATLISIGGWDAGSGPRRRIGFSLVTLRFETMRASLPAWLSSR